MDHLGSLNAFVQVAETLSFTHAARRLGISSSAVGKSIVRLEDRLAVRLFHRSTRAVSLTPEGALFLERCRRIQCELEAAERELAQAKDAPRGRLKVSVPPGGGLFIEAMGAFKLRYPDIELELDCSDRLVDVIEEGFDAVIRCGGTDDSRLMARGIGSFRQTIVASPTYLRRAGTPQKPADLMTHARLLFRFPATGKLMGWPLSEGGKTVDLGGKVEMVTNTLEPLLAFAQQGLGLACVPDYSVRQHIKDGMLVSVLDDYIHDRRAVRVLWPSSRHLAPRLRALVDFLADTLAMD